MITNIVDHRKHTYRWKKVTAIVEPTCHDNSCRDADQADLDESGWIGYDELAETSVLDAILWAQEFPCETTLYLYDLGDGIKEGVWS